MTGRIWFDVIVGFAAALLLSWLVLVIILVIRRSNGDLLKESLRLLPDLLRLLRRLTTNRDLPTGVRVRVALLFVYLAIPIDLIPTSFPSSATPKMPSSSFSSCAAYVAAFP